MTTKKEPKNRKRILVVANWKMNPPTVGLARKLFLDIEKSLGKKRKLHAQVAIAAPFPFISELQRLSPSQRIKLASQDVFFEQKGAFTGEVSLSMLKSVGVSSVITGHSETRALGETNENIARDVGAILKSTLTPIVCIGETHRDSHGAYFNDVEKQLNASLAHVSKSKLKYVVITYEPVWAISKGDGKGKTATPEDVHEMKLFIQKILADKFGRTEASKVRIIYGGSVNAKNAKELLESGQTEGFLVGGASLRAHEFSQIVNIAEKYGKK